MPLVAPLRCGSIAAAAVVAFVGSVAVAVAAELEGVEPDGPGSAGG